MRLWIALVGLLVLAGCGSSNESAATPPAGDSGFPARVEHKFSA